jgi:hypothetical protein
MNDAMDNLKKHLIRIENKVNDDDRVRWGGRVPSWETKPCGLMGLLAGLQRQLDNNVGLFAPNKDTNEDKQIR